VDPTTAAVLGGAGGLAFGAIAVAATRLSERIQMAPDLPAQTDPTALPPGVGDVLAVLRSVGIVVDAGDAVVKASPPAYAHGLVRDGELVHAELRHLARQVRRDGVIRESTLELAKGPVGTGTVTMGARVAPLGSAYVLLLVDDQTQARRVEEVRRDFVANVSHELKTPVGGLALLAEAVQNAKDDPEAVARFAKRMRKESKRLTRLVQEIVDLSRLQVADTLHEPVRVDVCAAAAEAAEGSRLVAEAKHIEIDLDAVAEGCEIFGDTELVITAISNLVDNAVAYSAEGTRVAVSVRRVTVEGDDLVLVCVADQGQGIPATEQQRVFERFYRVDPARSRATGGTGLGLAIVKHVAVNHGGEVTVWSEPGQGSTFTLRLPVAPTETETESADATVVARQVLVDGASTPSPDSATLAGPAGAVAEPSPVPAGSGGRHAGEPREVAR